MRRECSDGPAANRGRSPIARRRRGPPSALPSARHRSLRAQPIDRSPRRAEPPPEVAHLQRMRRPQKGRAVQNVKLFLPCSRAVRSWQARCSLGSRRAASLTKILRALGTPEDEFGRFTFLRRVALVPDGAPLPFKPDIELIDTHPRSTTPCPASCAPTR